MPTIPCKVSITCPGSDDPRSNFSSEAPDVIRFGAVGWAPPPVDPVLPPITDPNAPPIVPNAYLVPGCIALCFSTVSLQEAVLCAQRQALLCSYGRDGGLLNPLGPTVVTIPTNQVQQCTYICPDGTAFVTTVGAGTFAGATLAEANEIASAYACQVAANSFICLGALTPEACTGSAYSSSTTAIGGNAPLVFTIESGALPPGLSLATGLDGRTVIVSGTPTTPGVYAFHLSAVDISGHTLLKLFTITVTGVDQATLPDATVGTAYAQTLTAGMMTLPFTWALASGSLPAGLSLNSVTGGIAGTPTTQQTSSFTVRVTDALGVSCTKALSIKVGPGFNPSAWWTWNGGVVLPFNDSVHAQPIIDDVSSPGHYAFVAGKINEALEITPNLFSVVNLTQSPSTTFIANIANGFTITGWIRANVAGGNDFFGMEVFLYNGVFPPPPPRVYTLFVQFEESVPQLHANVTDNGGFTLMDCTLPMAIVPGTWYFVRMGWDHVTQRLYLSVNNGAPVQSAFTDPLNTPFTTGRTVVYCQNFNGGTSVDFDEVNVWPSFLTQAQLDVLWNGGAGKTYTDLFP